MVKMSATYTGGLHCELSHGPSGTRIETDAPKDNQGKGERFSPTDLIGASLAACVLTTIAIVAERDGLSMAGARAEVEKGMSKEPPRRIAELPLRVTLPRSIPEASRPKLERAGNHCPVHQSLHPDVRALITYDYE
ncbi:MAG: OsmC family protein [Bdellovibrionota bacterium]